MAELEWEGRPERPSLRRAIRHRLRRFDPTLRVIAEGFLAEVSTIDLLAVGGEGELISIRIGRGGDDIALLTQSLADLTWLEPRLQDFLKLAPGLGLEPSAEPRGVLFCPQFARETQAAVDNFPARLIELATYRCLRQHGQLSVLLEPGIPTLRPSGQRSASHADRLGARARAGRQALSEPSEGLAGPPSPTRFRTGLTEADLRVDVEEEKSLD